MLNKQSCKIFMLSVLAEKIGRLQQNLEDIRISLANETKSSAGDKYETARAMLHTEQDNLQRQLQELLRQQAIVEILDTQNVNTVIAPGSLVHTDKMIFYISVAAGKITAGENTFMAISPSSPLGQKLCGLSKKANAELNGVNYSIEEIF